MTIWARIRRLKIGQLIPFSLLFLNQPFLIRPTLRATKRTMVICDNLFGQAHHRSNKANAFRHALWNVLICHKTLKKTKNIEKSIIWAKKVTNLYEKVTNNEEIEKAMDVHNNNVGLDLFLSVFGENEEEIVVLLQKMMKKSEKVTNLEDFARHGHALVHLE